MTTKQRGHPVNRIDVDKASAKNLGWAVVDHGQKLDGSHVLLFLGGRDDMGLVRFRVGYRRHKTTGAFRFHRAVVEWPETGTRTTITSQKRLWSLVEAYAPKEDA